MRVKQTAKKITHEHTNEIIHNNNSIDIENSEHNSGDNVNDISDNEVEFLVECRRDQEGNQFLLDGTLVIEPAAVDPFIERKENQDATNEINFDDGDGEIQITSTKRDSKDSYCAIAPKKLLQNSDSNPNTYSTVKCTACSMKFNPFFGPTLFQHPLMGVILCSICIENQKEEYFIIDKEDNKETLCRWCVEGGSLICCDFCSKSFCKSCIKRNLGRTTLSEILGQDDAVQWKCFVCDPRTIESLKISCKKVVDDVEAFAERQRNQKLSKRPISKASEVVVMGNTATSTPNTNIGKKRPISRAFPGISEINGHKRPTSTSNSNSNSGSLLSNMANFGTDWYLRNVKLRDILAEIDAIDPRSLLSAINSTKRCVEAFYSDVRNLEVEISKATAASDIPAVVAMFKAVYRHHLFNRFCQVQARVEEDRVAKMPCMATNNINTNSMATAVVNTHSVPSLTINNVVSTAPFVSRLAVANQRRDKVVKAAGCGLGNGLRGMVVTSIDLTGGADDDHIDLPPFIR